MAGAWSAPVGRRRVLLAVAATPVLGSLAGCGLHDTSSDPDGYLVEQALDEETALVAAYDRLIPTLPARAAMLTAFRAHHVAHQAALGRLLSGRQIGARPTPMVQAVTLPTVVAMERAAAGRRADESTVAPQRLAALLGSISASETVHADLLAGG